MKTALDWLIEQMPYEFRAKYAYDLFKQAKELEKEQIIKTASDVDSVNFWAEYEGFEEYYNQTYNQNKSFTYCQREIEGQSICDKQCEHCKEYYAPLENQNK